MSLTLLFVGAGPRTLGVLDRLSAHASAAGTALDVHVVDPHPAGAGRIWRADQHPLLWMNSRAADVTVLPDASSRLDGPVRTGPTLFAWLEEYLLQSCMTGFRRPVFHVCRRFLPALPSLVVFSAC